MGVGTDSGLLEIDTTIKWSDDNLTFVVTVSQEKEEEMGGREEEMAEADELCNWLRVGREISLLCGSGTCYHSYSEKDTRLIFCILG